MYTPVRALNVKQQNCNIVFQLRLETLIQPAVVKTYTSNKTIHYRKQSNNNLNTINLNKTIAQIFDKGLSITIAQIFDNSSR